MGRHQAVGSGMQQHSQNVQDRIRYSTHYSISRPRSSRTSSFLVQSISPVALTKWFAQLPRSIVRYPSRWLGATWLVLVCVGGISAVTLFKIDPIEPEPSIATSPVASSVSIPSSENPAEKHQVKSSAGERANLTPGESKESLPLFALGTVALSCAIGCLLLSYRLSTRSSKAQPRLLTRPTRLPRPSTAAPRKIAASSAEAIPLADRSTHSDQADASAVTVSVIASHESHPLDWDGPSLADNLDIRQRRPLSHWL